MKIYMLAVYLLFAVFISTPAQTIAPLTLEHTLSLPGVTGKFDHFAMDEAGNRLFAAAGGNHAVIVIDLATGKILQTLPDVGKPHGLAWIAETKQLFVADGSGAVLDVFEGIPLKLVKSIKLSEDADDLAYDSTDKVIYVGHGGTDAANPAGVSAVDVERLTLIGTLPLAAHPEGIEFDPSGDRVFANVSDTGEIAVINGRTHSIEGTWPLDDEKGNTPLAYDAADGFLLVGCRTPAKLLVLSASNGRQISSIRSDTGADDLFYEPSTHTAYLITGSGTVDSYEISPAGKVKALTATKTAAGAKTGLLVPSQRVLYVGVPGTGAPSEVFIYKTSSK